jgi:hypothetical protein
MENVVRAAQFCAGVRKPGYDFNTGVVAGAEAGAALR